MSSRRRKLNQSKARERVRAIRKQQEGKRDYHYGLHATMSPEQSNNYFEDEECSYSSNKVGRCVVENEISSGSSPLSGMLEKSMRSGVVVMVSLYIRMRLPWVLCIGMVKGEWVVIACLCQDPWPLYMGKGRGWPHRLSLSETLEGFCTAECGLW